jgi:hypothetical protein
MKRIVLAALSGLLLAGCGQNGGPLLPELNGRWVSEDFSALQMTTTGSGAPFAASSLDEQCQRSYVTFERFPMDLEFAGSVTVHRPAGSEVVFMVGSASREGDRITMTGRLPNTPPSGRMQIELVLRDGGVVLDDVRDRLGRSVSNNLFHSSESVQTERLNFTTIGDHFRAALDVKSCSGA